MNISIEGLDIDDALALLFDPDVDLDDFAEANGIEQCRIVHAWGHGDWHTLESESRLMEKCSDLNTRYPGGNHRVEYRIHNSEGEE